MPGLLDAPEPRLATRLRVVQPLLGYVALALGLGGLAGVLWWRIVDLPGYLVNSAGGATTTERGLAEFIGGDAWFALLGAVVGLLLGWLAWVRLQQLGWPVVLLTALAALAAALVCWFVGYHLGPGDFSERLTSAHPGETVPIQLTLRARASLLVWPFTATIPVLLGSSLGVDDEEPKPIFKKPLRLRRVLQLRRLFSRRSTPPGPTAP